MASPTPSTRATTAAAGGSQPPDAARKHVDRPGGDGVANAPATIHPPAQSDDADPGDIGSSLTEGPSPPSPDLYSVDEGDDVEAYRPRGEHPSAPSYHGHRSRVEPHRGLPYYPPIAGAAAAAFQFPTAGSIAAHCHFAQRFEAHGWAGPRPTGADTLSATSTSLMRSDGGGGVAMPPPVVPLDASFGVGARANRGLSASSWDDPPASRRPL